MTASAGSPTEEPERKKLKTSAEGGDDDKINAIVAQLEYYFSDVNVIKDKFMKEEFAKNDGWISIETMLKFAKLKALTENPKDIVDALTSCKSDVIELDPEATKIKRKKELPSEEVQKELDDRTLHLSGFPLDYTYENLFRWCNQYGETESICMRFYRQVKKFKGNIIVTFSQKKAIEKLTEIDALKCKDRQIRLETMEAYRKRKAEMAKKREERNKSKKQQKSSSK